MSERASLVFLGLRPFGGRFLWCVANCIWNVGGELYDGCQIGLQKYTFAFKQDGTNLTGKASLEINDQKRESELKEGKVDGDAISFIEMLNFQDNEIRINYTGKLSTNANEINFTREVGDIAKEAIVAKREPAAAAAVEADITGEWQAQFDTQRGLQKYTFTFKQDGTSVT